MKPFITTFTGRKVNPLDLRVEDIDVLDIGHHLSCLNRFVGALRQPVNVAHHSVNVYRLLKGSIWAKEGLFHDAPEAYLGDVSKWVKQMPEMAAYRDAEHRAWLVICEALGLNYRGCPEMCPAVEDADRLMVRYEAMRLSTNPRHMQERPKYPEPSLDEQSRIHGWWPAGWELSKEMFLGAAADLGFHV